MILGFVIGIATLAAVWVTAKRLSVAYVARFGRRPPNGWMFSRVDDPALEHGRRVLLVILAAAVTAIVLLFWSYPT